MGRAIEIENLIVDYSSRNGVVRAINGLSLDVEEGEVYGFLGPNGAGKTTIIHVLLGFIEALSGHARIFGQDVGTSVTRQRLGYLPEHCNLYLFLTGRELLTISGKLHRLTPNFMKERIKWLAEEIGFTDIIDRRIATYSRGMLQKIGLAQALVHDPDLVILDEPTIGFDPPARIGIRKLMASLREQGKTIFFSSHELSEVELVCDHVGIIAQGRLIAGGRVNELVNAGENLERYFLRVIS